LEYYNLAIDFDLWFRLSKMIEKPIAKKCPGIKIDMHTWKETDFTRYEIEIENSIYYINPKQYQYLLSQGLLKPHERGGE